MPQKKFSSVCIDFSFTNCDAFLNEFLLIKSKSCSSLALQFDVLYFHMKKGNMPLDVLLVFMKTHVKSISKFSNSGKIRSVI